MITARERWIATGLMVAIGASVAFSYAFWKQASTQWQGFCLACVFGGFTVALLGWAKWILPHEEVVDLRDTYPQPEEERRAQDRAMQSGLTEITRKRWLTRLLFAALGVFGMASVLPIGSLGPKIDDALFETKWRPGRRLQRPDGSLVRASDMNVNGIVTVFPENDIGDYNSMAVLIQLPPGVGLNTVNGLIAYSKACTHAGCPVALYRSTDHVLICPCHQSMFDAADNAKIIEGPADHNLPRLPIEVSSDGYVRATGTFTGPPGPGFWEQS
jgi:ubiquinol-cytochrome c reductase iron-sulfur subunit